MEKIKQKYNELKLKVPVNEAPFGIILLILNIFLPGFGTMCFSCIGGNDNWEIHLACGMLQFVFSWTIIGWIWSILWGCYNIGYKHN